MKIYDYDEKVYRELLSFSYDVVERQIISVRIKAFKGEFASQDSFESYYIAGLNVKPLIKALSGVE